MFIMHDSKCSACLKWVNNKTKGSYIYTCAIFIRRLDKFLKPNKIFTMNFLYVFLLASHILQLSHCLEVHYDKVTANCITENGVFWKFYAAHFSSESVVTINILHAQDHEYLMSYFINFVLRFASFHTKLEKTLIVRHIDWPENGEGVTPLLLTNKFHSSNRDAYILLIWDELVLSRYLDEYPGNVIQNPRGKYVILFTYNIAKTCLRWNKQFEKTIARFWLEFGVMDVLAQMPCSCNSDIIHVYRPFRRINSTSWGGFDTFNITKGARNVWNVPLFNLNQYPVKISMFPRIPTAIKAPSLFSNASGIYDKINKIGGYVGIDGCIIHDLAKYMNFTPVFFDTDFYKYGGVLPNGTITGSLGDILYRKADIAGNGRFVMDYGVDVEFTTPFLNDYLCLVVPKSQKIPKWVMIFHGFSLNLWLGLTSTLLTCMVLFHFIKCKVNVVRNTPGWLNIFSIFVNSPVPLSYRFLSQRMFLAFVIYFCVITSAVFQGSLVTSYSTDVYYPDSDTLEDVDASGLLISSNLDVFSENSSSETIKRLRQKRITLNGTNSMAEAANFGYVAALERKLDAQFYIGTVFLDASGAPLLHIVKECAASYFVSFAVRKGSPYLPRFNNLIGNFAEQGMNKKWYDDFVNYISLKARFNRTQHEDGRKAFSVKDMQTVFYFLVVGLSLSCFVFVGELVWFKCKVNKKKFNLPVPL